MYTCMYVFCRHWCKLAERNSENSLAWSITWHTNFCFLFHIYLYLQMLNCAIKHCFYFDVIVHFFKIYSVIIMCRSVLDNPENQEIREQASRSRRKSRSEDENEDKSSKKLKLEAVANTVTATNTTTTTTITTTDTKVEQGPDVLETASNQKWAMCLPNRQPCIYERWSSSFGTFARSY